MSREASPWEGNSGCSLDMGGNEGVSMSLYIIC